MTRLAQRLLVSLMLAAGVMAAAAADFPSGPVRLVVPVGSGGMLDLMARLISAKLRDNWRQPIIVENRSGAGFVIGTAVVAKAAPDGQTLLLTTAGHTVSGSLYVKLPYDPIKDFVGVALVGTSCYQLLASVDLPAKNVAELITYAKANPGKLNYASAGIGSGSHLSVAYLAYMAGIDLVHVPTRGMAEASNELVAGRSQMMIFAGGTQYAKEPRVRILGVTSMERSKFLPDVPTINENGLPGYEFDSWYGLLAPSSTPRNVVARINADVNKLVKEPSIIEGFAKLSVEPFTLSPEEFDKMLRSHFEKMARVVAISGAKVE